MKAWKYDSEKELVNDFNKAYINTLRKGKNVLILPEINTNWGIADVLSIHYDKSKLTKRCETITSTPLDFSNLAAYAMTYLSESLTTTIEDLGDYLKVKNGPLAHVLDILISRGLVYVYKDGTVRSRMLTKCFVIKNILAFEAKISNWKRAIDQAERHLWFTGNSFVIVPGLTRTTVQKINFECSRRGIGLIVQSGNKSFKVVREPIRKSCTDSYFSWKLNELLIDRSISNDRCNPSGAP